MIDTILLTALIFTAAVLYSSVGHAGASGYLAAGALLGFPQTHMRPAALLLNVFVASIGTYRFWRARLINWNLLLPFAIASAPLAFVGGRWRLNESVYQIVLGCVLLAAAANLILQAALAGRTSNPSAPKSGKTAAPPIPVALGVGAGIGMLAGMTGVGGGIFLSPLLILARWADPRTTAAVSAPFILINSVAGIAGQMRSGQFHPLRTLPLEFLLWAAAAIMGGLIGSYFGARRLSNPLLRGLLALVLLIAGVKLIAT
jgi:uncharacterized membrane protein YfcA